MGRVILLVGFGGFLGSLLRYFTATGFLRVFPAAFPYGTFVVNVVGCLLVGLVYGITARTVLLSPDWRLFLATGFCGGFTTFSSFAYESIELMQNSDTAAGFLYILLSIFAGLAAAAGGMYLTRAV